MYDLERARRRSRGLPTDQIARLWRSLGFAEPQPGDRMFTDVDAEMLRTRRPAGRHG